MIVVRILGAAVSRFETKSPTLWRDCTIFEA